MSRHALYTLGCVAAYTVLFLLFEWVGYALGVLQPIPVWHATAGIHLALALLIAPRTAAPVIAAAVALEWTLAPVEVPGWGVGLIAIVHAGLYVAAARLMQRYLAPPLASLHTAHTFLLAALVLPALVATTNTAALATMSVDPFQWDAWAEWTARWGLSDIAGILTVTPLGALLGWSMHPAYREHGVEWIEWLPTAPSDRLAYAAEWLLVPLALYVAFFAPAVYLPQYYVCFLPVLWIALRHGLPTTSAVVFATALGIALLRMTNQYPESMVEVQLFLIVLAAAGLLMGMLISERDRAQLVLAETGKRLRGYLPPDAVASPSTSRPSASSAHVLEQNTRLLATTADQIAALNNELQASQERLRSTLAATNRMMSILSHDLKNPLVGIRGLAEVLTERENRSEREARMLRLIQQSSQQALDMVENLLLWSRLDTNKMKVDPHRASLHMMTQECFTLLGGMAQQKTIDMVNKVPTAFQVYVDPRMMTIALRNFLSNAIKFTEADGRVVVAAEPVNDAWALVAVSDTGIGISKNAQHHLFDSSTEPRSAPGTDGELGTGLGLQLCDEMIRRHEGEVWVESKPGKGTTFYFTIPRMSEPPSSPPPGTVETTMSDALAALPTSRASG